MTGDEYIKAQIARAAWLRAKENGPLAMLAVAMVVRNLERTGKSWLAACDEVTVECFGGNPDVRNPDFQKLLYGVESIFDGTAPDKLTNGATLIGYLGEAYPGYQQCAVVSGLVLLK
jgi:hypothetical protein